MENKKMETPADQFVDEIPQDNSSSGSKQGGIRAIPFIIANEAFERVASVGLMPNMILYLLQEYKLSLTNAQTILYFWQAASNFLPALGAFISDTYIGRFLAITLGCFFSLVGMILLWLTSMIPETRPSPCTTGSCKSADSGQLAILVCSFIIMSIGSGGIRACSMAFGADQLNKKENTNASSKRKALESYFGWYYASAASASMIAITAVVYIQDEFGWKIGFGIPAICMLVSTVVFLVASPLYIKVKQNTSLFTGLAQAAVAAFKNRKFTFPDHEDSDELYHRKKDSEYVKPSDKLRCLNKGCIITNPDQDIGPDGLAINPWRLCTIEQVEELKALIKVIPIWSTGVVMGISTSTGSFGLLQCKSMDRHLTPNFEVPAGSFSVFMILTIAIWILFYDRVLIPMVSRIRGKHVSLSTKVRMGIGLIFACLHMAISAITETVRRSEAIKHGYQDNPNGVLTMSAFWLVPSLAVSGLSEAFFIISQNEFYYTEFPRSMSSIATSLSGLHMGVSSLIANVLINGVNQITSGTGRVSWLADNINRGHLDYYYWLLSGLGLVNIFYFLLCSWLYGPCGDRNTKKVRDEVVSKKHEQELVDLQTGENKNEEKVA